jgi:hypothetical protein
MEQLRASGSWGEAVGSIKALVEFVPDSASTRVRRRLLTDACVQAPDAFTAEVRTHLRFGERWTSAAPSRPRSATPRPRSARQLVGNSSRSRPSRPPRRSRAPTRAAASHCGESRSLDSAIPICEPGRHTPSRWWAWPIYGILFRFSFFLFWFLFYIIFSLSISFLFLFLFQIRKMLRSEKCSDFGNY